MCCGGSYGPHAALVFLVGLNLAAFAAEDRRAKRIGMYPEGPGFALLFCCVSAGDKLYPQVMKDLRFVASALTRCGYNVRPILVGDNMQAQLTAELDAVTAGPGPAFAKLHLHFMGHGVSTVQCTRHECSECKRLHRADFADARCSSPGCEGTVHARSTLDEHRFGFLRDPSGPHRIVPIEYLLLRVALHRGKPGMASKLSGPTTVIAECCRGTHEIDLSDGREIDDRTWKYQAIDTKKRKLADTLVLFATRQGATHAAPVADLGLVSVSRIFATALTDLMPLGAPLDVGLKAPQRIGATDFASLVLKVTKQARQRRLRPADPEVFSTLDKLLMLYPGLSQTWDH